MKNTAILSHIACGAVGIAIGVFILEPGADDATGKSTDPLPPQVTRSRRPAPDERDRRLSAARDLTRSIPDRESYSERKKWLDELPVSDLSSLIEGLCQNVAPDGLDHAEESLVEKALERWLKEDEGGAIAWVDRLPAGASKRYFMKQLVKTLLDTDPEQALAISETYQMEDEAWDHGEAKEKHVKKKIDKAWDKPDITASDMLSLFAELPRTNGSGGSAQKDYPEDFDFQTFLDGVAEWNEKDRKSPGTMPTDVLEVWAKRNPHAAAQWFLKTAESGANVPFQDWSNIADGICETSGAQAYYTWLGELLPGTSDKQLKAITRKIETRDALGIADAIADTRTRDRVLATMASQSYNGPDPGQTVNLLSEISAPGMKVEAVKGKSYRFRKWLDAGAITAEQFRQIGLSEEQVRAAVGK